VTATLTVEAISDEAMLTLAAKTSVGVDANRLLTAVSTAVNAFIHVLTHSRATHCMHATAIYGIVCLSVRPSVRRVGSITFKLYFNYKIQITFLKVFQILLSITLAMDSKIQKNIL